MADFSTHLQFDEFRREADKEVGYQSEVAILIFSLVIFCETCSNFSSLRLWSC